MISFAKGIYRRSPSRGIYFDNFYFGGNYVNTNELPSYLGEIPIGKKSWYRDPPLGVVLLEGMEHKADSDICCMRGSKCGIANLEFSGRVFAYDYYFARWAGRRFGSWSKRTGKRVLVIKSNKNRAEASHHAADGIIRQDFKEGFIEGFFGKDCFSQPDLRVSLDDYDFLQRIERVNGHIVGVSSFICLNLAGLSEEKREQVIELARSFASTEAIEKAMTENKQ